MKGLALVLLLVIANTATAAPESVVVAATQPDSTAVAQSDTATAKADTVAKKQSKFKRLHRMDREIQKMTFVPKDTWFGGLTVSYSEQGYDNLNTLLVKDIEGEGYTFGISPFVGYCFKNNWAAGMRFNYNRTLVDLRNFELNLGEDFNINLKDYYYLEQDYQVAGFVRTYMPLGRSKIFGFFNEMRLAYGHSQAKMTTGRYGETAFDGTFSRSDYFYLGFAPGLTAFVQDWMSIEVQLGVLGFNFKWTDQTTNQVEHGSQHSFSGKFNIDLFSINIGTCLYF